MTNDLTNLSVFDMQAGLRSGEFTCLELMEAHLQRIHTLEPRLNVLITLAEDEARIRAKQSDEQLRQARATDQTAQLPSLLGIPILVKDLITVKDMICTCGSNVLGDWVAPFTATAVQRLVNAGAIVIGKSNTDEFAMGSSTESSAFGPTRNPWDTTRVPGGSSGGSAAAVAARYVPAAIGSDTGGSIRQPAAFCGVTGIKPGYGRVSRYGLIAYGSSLDCMGVFARSAAETALFIQIMAGKDPLDATSTEQSTPDYLSDSASNLPGLKVGVPQEYFLTECSRRSQRRSGLPSRNLKTSGAEVIEISLPYQSTPCLSLSDRSRRGFCNTWRDTMASFWRTQSANPCWMFFLKRAVRVLALKSSAASCWALTRFQPAITTRITARLKKCAP
jgi:aspartyl-tRNA(Asn)/glutamyl-tRNA(Gln) amidotransferase subunit A